MMRGTVKILFAVVIISVIASLPANASIITFESTSPGQNATIRADWLGAIGIGSPQFLVDFETGFTDGQNISGVPGLFPMGLVITDTSPSAAAIIRSGAGVINGSNPVGVFSVTQNEQPYLQLDFSASPVDYVGFLDIDQAGTRGQVFFTDGSSATFSFITTGASGNTAQFFGIFRNDMPKITTVRFDASGDGLWGLDNIEYGAAAGVVPEPASLLLLGTGLCALFLSAWRRRK